MLFPKHLRRRVALCGVLICVGLPAGASPGLAAECVGDECQVPPPAPEEVNPGTAVVNGPENPPVHFPSHHKKKHHRKHHHRSRG